MLPPMMHSSARGLFPAVGSIAPDIVEAGEVEAGGFQERSAFAAR